MSAGEPPAASPPVLELTAAQVQEMAPDDASVKAGRKLGKAGAWQETGNNAAMIWGQCTGSRVYDVKFDRSNLGYHCTCPSRKFPCKHVLGLLFLRADSPGDVPDEETAPSWASEWLDKRKQRAETRKKKESEPRKPVDAAAQAKRAAARLKKVTDGLDRLDVWMQDLIRGGLAGLESKGFEPWSDQAKRLVDAQAATLASRVERLAEIPGSGRDWPERLLGELGRLKWITDAYRRCAADEAASGSPELAALRQQVGFTVDAAELAARGEAVTDRWHLVGQTLDEAGRVRTQTTWLIGEATGREATVVQFAAGTASFEQTLVPGTVREADATFYPGRSTRVKLGDATSTSEMAERLAGHATVDSFLDAAATVLTERPWDDRVLASLHGVTVRVGKGGGGGPRAAAWGVGEGSDELPLCRGTHWDLLAISGGHPVDLFGMWDGQVLTPLGVLSAGQYRRLP